MAMRSAIVSRSSGLFSRSGSCCSVRLLSDQGRVLSEEERAAETVYIKKMEKEQLEKKKLKEAKEKAEKEKAEKKMEKEQLEKKKLKEAKEKAEKEKAEKTSSLQDMGCVYYRLKIS
ncbi:hypothetical protein CTI12_AA503450 [Artemisia annua]|uniref:Uncharacterized protein n=1 Tax=Artemisia annua TaxID=35608 RepID=A0A2U1LCM4_ARTAN|nr:hypothetical protein CTI12_AA503450 [Artemisia annua]